MIINDAINQQLASGASICHNGFEGIVPQRQSYLSVDDIFTIDSQFNVLQDAGTNVMYVLAETESGKVVKIFPSFFYRQVRDVNGKVYSSNGSACEMFRMFGTINDAMRSLAGKRIKVSNIEWVQRLNPFSQVMNVPVYTFDFV